MNRFFTIIIFLSSFIGLLHAQGIIALKDNFSDGNITQNPSWEAGDMHWFNPFFVEKVNDRHWAGSKRYGSMGTFFSHPKDRFWPIPLDAGVNPITLSFRALFRTSTEKDRLYLQLKGAESFIDININPEGNMMVRFSPVNRKTGPKVAHGWARIPKFKPAQEVNFKIIFGGPKVLTIDLDGKRIYELEKDRQQGVKKHLKLFDRLAVMGANIAKEPNVHLLVPQLQDTKAFRWITDIEVRGTPGKLSFKKQPKLKASPKSALVFSGVAAIGAQPTKSLAESGWKVTEALDDNPLRGKALADFRKHLQIDDLCKNEWVILFDINVLNLGSHGCTAIKEYVRCGGKLLILGGVSTLNRGRYFSSPLKKLMPVTGKVSWNSLEKAPKLTPDFAYKYEIKSKQKTKKLSLPIIVYEKQFGKGTVRVVADAVLGTSKTPYWRQEKWLGKLLLP